MVEFEAQGQTVTPRFGWLIKIYVVVEKSQVADYDWGKSLLRARRTPRVLFHS